MTEQVNTKNSLTKWVILLGILATIFFATTLYFGFFAKPVFNSEYIKTVVEKELLEIELDSLMADHERIKLEYGDLSEQLSEKDSMILANAEEIKKLIAGQADYRKIKRQLERLQNIAKEYVTEIDQLFTENKQLKAENTQVKQHLADSRRENENIQKEKQELNQTLNSAAVHQAYNIHSRAIYFKNKNSEEVVTEKATRVDQLKTTFILGANSLIPAGPVTVYCRIAIPGTGRILSPGSGDAFSFTYNNDRLPYTAKKTINYDNKAEITTITWDLKEGDKAVKGKYFVQLYTEDQFLGDASFELK